MSNQSSGRNRKLTIAGLVLAGIPGTVISVFSLLIGLAICIVCVLLFPIGLLGFPFAIGFFIIPIMFFGGMGAAIKYKSPKEIAAKVLQGDASIPEDVIINAANSLLNSKRDEDQQLGRVLRAELEKRREKH